MQPHFIDFRWRATTGMFLAPQVLQLTRQIAPPPLEFDARAVTVRQLERPYFWPTWIRVLGGIPGGYYGCGYFARFWCGGFIGTRYLWSAQTIFAACGGIWSTLLARLGHVHADPKTGPPTPLGDRGGLALIGFVRRWGGSKVPFPDRNPILLALAIPSHRVARHPRSCLPCLHGTIRLPISHNRRR